MEVFHRRFSPVRNDASVSEVKNLSYDGRLNIPIPAIQKGPHHATFLAIVALAGLALLCGNSTVHAEDAPAKIKVLIITGDDVDVHNWKETTAAVRKILVDSGRFDVQVSEDLKPLDSADALKVTMFCI